MIYIVVALKSEAQAFVEKYKLHKSKLHQFLYFTDENIRLIVSGLGVNNAREATQTLINEYDITDEDIYLNIGICGANGSYEIMQLVEIGTIIYKEISYTFSNIAKTLHCEDEPISQALYEMVDMESFGFYDAVTHNPAIQNFHIFKVVSDHFEPQKVTKDGTKKLISKNIDAINTLLLSKD